MNLICGNHIYLFDTQNANEIIFQVADESQLSDG